MNHSFFEGRFLVNIVGGIIRQDALFPSHNKRIDWERIFRLADYHKVANIVYLGVLGSTETIEAFWKNKFFDRYKEALAYNDIYEREEESVLRMLDANGVQCTVLSSASIREFYEIPESAGNAPLYLILSEQDYSLAKGYLVDNDYLTDAVYTGYGERMSKASGFSVVLYYRLPFETEQMQKVMRKVIEGAYRELDFKGISSLSMEYTYVYHMAECAYLYCCDMLNIRTLLNTFLMFRAYREEMDLKLAEGLLAKMGIDKIAETLLHIAAMWFGRRDENVVPYPKENMVVYDEVESRILGERLKGEEEKLRQADQLRAQIEKQTEKLAKLEEKKNRKAAKAMMERVSGGAGILGKLFGGIGRGDRDRVGLQTEGAVTYRVGKGGIHVITPYFSFLLPESVYGYARVRVASMDEDFSESDTKTSEHNPGNYKLFFDFLPQVGNPVPIFQMMLFADAENAWRESSREDRYYLGLLTHIDEYNEYDSHLVAMYDYMRDLPKDEDGYRYDAIIEKRDISINSIVPINDPAGRNINLLERFTTWKTDRMPEKYRLGL